MENLLNVDVLRDFLLSTLEVVPREWFVYIPWAIAIALAVVAMLNRRSNPEDVRLPNRRWNIRTPLLIGTLSYTVTSCLLFLYILLQPLRTGGSRWLEGATVIEPPKVSKVPEGPDLSGLPFGADKISDYFNGFTSSTNETITSVNQTTATVVEQINLVNAYKHTLGIANEFLMYSFWGLAAVFAALVFWWFARRTEKSRVKAAQAKQEEEKERANQRTQKQVAFLLKRVNDMNRAAYSQGVAASGHSDDEVWPYDNKYDFVINGYANYARMMSEKEAEQIANHDQYVERV